MGSALSQGDNPWNINVTRNQIPSIHGVGVRALWKYITLHIRLIMTLLVGLPLVNPRTPAGLV